RRRARRRGRLSRRVLPRWRASRGPAVRTSFGQLPACWPVDKVPEKCFARGVRRSSLKHFTKHAPEALGEAPEVGQRSTERRTLRAASMTRLRLVARPAAVRALGALLLASLAGCVPVTRLEEAQSVAEVEAESRRRAAIALAAERERAAKLEASLAEREAALQEQQRLLDEQRLATSITEKERDESAVLVEQLRGELSRAGDHLRAYSEQKAELERELADTEPPADGDAASMPDATPPPAGYGAPDAKGAEIDAAMGIPAAPLTPPATDPTPPSNAADLGAVARQIRQALAAGGLEKKISV